MKIRIFEKIIKNFFNEENKNIIKNFENIFEQTIKEKIDNIFRDDKRINNLLENSIVKIINYKFTNNYNFEYNRSCSDLKEKFEKDIKDDLIWWIKISPEFEEKAYNNDFIQKIIDEINKRQLHKK